MVTRISFPLLDPPPPRGRRRSFYLTSLDPQIRPLEHEKVKERLARCLKGPEYEIGHAAYLVHIHPINKQG